MEARFSAGQIPIEELWIEPGLNEKDGFELLDHSSQLALAESAQQHLDLSYLDSIKTSGVLQPLIVFRGADKRLFIEDGHRRYLRALIAKLIEGIDLAPIPFIFSRNASKFATKIDRQMTQLIANSSQPSHPWEEARVVRNAIDAGWSIDQIAQKTGRSLQE
jgi:ParB-like nuclease domain